MFDRPIFIVGCTNSGTKCLFHSLMGHPDLAGPEKELHFYGIAGNYDGRINRLFSLFPNFNTNYLDESCTPRSFGTGPTFKPGMEHLLKHILTTEKVQWEQPIKKRMLFKDPKLSLRIRWIKHLWPDSYIVAIIRNPWATIEGIIRRLPLMGDVPLNLDVPTATAQWHATNTIIELDSKSIDNFQIVRYEDMISATKFPGDASENCFWSRLLSHLNLSIDGFQIPNDSKYSHFKQDKNSNSLENLSAWDINYISQACKDLIIKYGYNLKNEQD